MTSYEISIAHYHRQIKELGSTPLILENVLFPDIVCAVSVVTNLVLNSTLFTISID